MKKAIEKNRVNVSTLKSKLSAFLSLVKAGQEIVVTDRAQPIAKVIPFETPAAGEVEVIPAKGSRKTLQKLSRVSRLKTTVSAVDLLIEERRKR